MNLFIEEIANHIIEHWDESLQATEGQHEARFIIQSLGPLETRDLFERLQTHATHHYDPASTRCYFRTAKGLWKEWNRQAPGATEAIATLEQANWIDLEDRLTWYRSRLAQDEGVDGLVTVLLGLNHAAEPGSLADFHIVDEQRIRERLQGSLIPWLERICERLGVSASATQLSRFNAFLSTLSELRPLQLGRLANFLEPLIAKGDCLTFDDFRQRVMQALPEWGIPPILADTQGRLPDDKQASKALKDAEAFISHRGYTTPSTQNRDLQKLAKAIEDPDFELPLRPDGSPEFKDKEDFSQCLEDFIRRADPEAKQRLLGVDALPTVVALKKKDTKPDPIDGNPPPKRTSITTYDDLSSIAFLSALWDAVLLFNRSISRGVLSDRLGDMTMHFVSLEHDFHSSDDDGNDDQGARDLLKGILGGLEARFERDIAENLSVLWGRTLRINFELNPNELTVIKIGGKKRPSLFFQINIADESGTIIVEDAPYRWYMDSTQPERVRHVCIDKTQRDWDQFGANASGLLPAFQINRVNLTALFYAADSEEAQRLIGNAAQDIKLLNLREGLSDSALDPGLLSLLQGFIKSYRQWLQATLVNGYYHALQHQVTDLITAYKRLVEALLGSDLIGANDLLNRVYKAMLLIGDDAKPNEPYLENCVAWGLTPSVLELSMAQTRFLVNGFSEVLAELSVRGPAQAKPVFERLLSLARIQRPITTLIKNSGGELTTRVRDLGLIHCAGEVASLTNSLAVQTLLQEDDNDDDEELKKILRPREEQGIVCRVLDLHSKLNDYAADGVRVLAVNVSDLAVILRGLQDYLEEIVKGPSDYPSFECTLMVYSAAASPLSMENRLAHWRDGVLGALKEGQRGLILSVGHRFAPLEQIVDELKRERHAYDIAFLFHFLRTDMKGKIEGAQALDLRDLDGSDSFFPIVEYPRPIQAAQHNHREMLLSNRRLQVQTRHADMSARLRYPGGRDHHHIVLGQVDFANWSEAVQALHEKAHWVACIDSFVDKRLLLGASRQSLQDRRKIVGFESGLGDYGELNLTISTEVDTLDQLIEKTHGELVRLLRHAASSLSPKISERMVADAEEVAGLASLRAVLGDGEQVREVVGFAAIHRMLRPADALISQLLPLDAFRAWLADPDEVHRPDLLQLSLSIGEDGIPEIHGIVIECKVGKQNSVHSHKALQQVRSGLFQLSRVLAPRCTLFQGVTFDRRYWWAQLQRAIASRAEVHLSSDDWSRLSTALERVVEGQYRICWHGMVFTFWTDWDDDGDDKPRVTPHRIYEQVAPASMRVPPEFYVEQVEMGHRRLVRLFEHATPAHLQVAPSTPSFCIDFKEASNTPSWETTAPDLPEEYEEEPIEEAGTEEIRKEPDDLIEEKAFETMDESSSNENSTIEVKPTPDQPPPLPAHEGIAFTPNEPTGEDEVSPPPGSEITVPPLEVASKVPDKILVGTRSNGEPVYWHYGSDKLPNRHLLLFGTSGSGKTYGIQCLLAELATASIRSLVVDYTDGFLLGQMEKRFWKVARPMSHYVKKDRLPLNPFRRQKQVIDASEGVEFEESIYDVATRIVSIFSSVYNLGQQQTGSLSRCLQSAIEGGGNDALDELLTLLADDSSQGQSVANKIEPFVMARPFRPEATITWKKMLASEENGAHILQLKGLSRDIQRVVTEFILWDLWDFAQNTGGKENPIPIVLDEIQNLDHSSDSPIDKMLREGRKFGLSLILATQTTSNFNNEQRDRLFQAGHKLFFKPATTETDRFAQILAQAAGGTKGEWAERLARLEKGQCWSLGPVVQADGRVKESALLVSVTALEQRTFGGLL